MPPPGGRPTLAQLAAQLDLSQTAVSRALRDMPDIGTETRKRVREAAAAVGYRPNWAARSLATTRTNMIGIGMGSFTNPFFHEVTAALVKQARAKEFSTLMFEVGPGGGPELEVRMSGAVDAILLFEGWYAIPITVADILRLESRHAPVLYRGLIEGGGIDQVEVDWEDAAYHLTSHLLGLGHTRMAVLRGIPALAYQPLSPCAKTRGTMRAYADVGLSFDADSVYLFPSTLENARNVSLDVLSRQSRPTAIICHTDYLAVGAMRAAQDLGLKVPADVSIAGFNDIEFGRFLPITLTTISHDKDLVAAEMINRIAERLDGSRLPRSRPSIVSHRLIVRESSAAPAARPVGAIHPG
jgi:LacI family repressor for deo operon, udp, cdd, tsx, nupC, and nupG